MSDPNYPDDIRQYDSDPRSPFYKDPTNDAAFEDAKQEMLEARIESLVCEALSEMSRLTEKRLSKAVLAYETSTDVELRTLAKLEIGEIVWSVVHNYCEPTDEDVLDSIDEGE